MTSSGFNEMIDSLPDIPETWLHIAQLAESAERYDEMVEACKRLINISGELSEDERNLVSVAYKNIVGSRRSAFRVVMTLEGKSDIHHRMISEYKEKIRSELSEVCHEVIGLLDDQLLVKAGDVKSKVFYLKMKADYFRYLVEAATESTRADLAKRSRDAYEQANVDASSLHAANPIRLGLALNYSVFYYEIARDPTKACELAKDAFDKAIAELDSIKEEVYKDSTLIMQLLRDNLTLWMSEQETEDRADDDDQD